MTKATGCDRRSVIAGMGKVAHLGTILGVLALGVLPTQCQATGGFESQIDREAVVRRHAVTFSNPGMVPVYNTTCLFSCLFVGTSA